MSRWIRLLHLVEDIVQGCARVLVLLDVRVAEIPALRLAEILVGVDVFKHVQLHVAILAQDLAEEHALVDVTDATVDAHLVVLDALGAQPNIMCCKTEIYRMCYLWDGLTIHVLHAHQAAIIVAAMVAVVLVHSLVRGNALDVQVVVQAVLECVTDVAVVVQAAQEVVLVVVVEVVKAVVKAVAQQIVMGVLLVAEQIANQDAKVSVMDAHLVVLRVHQVV